MTSVVATLRIILEVVETQDTVYIDDGELSTIKVKIKLKRSAS